MILNLLIVLILLGSLLLWWTNGAFSAFLNLVAVVFAGAMAFALQEPVAFFCLKISVLSAMAWGAGLLLPFTIFLVIFRLGIDYFVRDNVRTHPIAWQLLGAFFGLCSGLVVCGVLVLGLSHMSTSNKLLGIQPYGLSAGGKITKDTPIGGRLWVPVDQWVAGFYTNLSTGSLNPMLNDNSLMNRRGDLVYEAHSARLSSDQNASWICPPSAVSVLSVYAAPYALQEDVSDVIQRAVLRGAVKEGALNAAGVNLENNSTDLAEAIESIVGLEYDSVDQSYLEKVMPVLGFEASEEALPLAVDVVAALVSYNAEQTQDLSTVFEGYEEGTKLIVLHARFESTPRGLFDTDGTLRLNPHQLGLRMKGAADLHLPVAWTYSPTGQVEGVNRKELLSVHNFGVISSSNADGAEIGLVYVVPNDLDLSYLMVRGTRVMLENQPVISDVSRLVAVMGELPAPEQVPEYTEIVEATKRTLGEEFGNGGVLEITAALPIRTSVVDITNSGNNSAVTEVEGRTGRFLKEGAFTFRVASGRVGQNTRVKELFVGGAFECVRITMDRRAWQQAFGSDFALVANQTLSLIGSQDSTRYTPHAVVVKRGGASNLTVHMNMAQEPIITGTVLAGMNPAPSGSDVIYLYYNVLKGETIRGFVTPESGEMIELVGGSIELQAE